jgi:hypothetical protein
VFVPPRHEGRTRRHEREAGCGGREEADRRAVLFADGEVVWSWRAHAGAKSSSRHAPREDDGGNKLVHRGEREVSRKPPRREGRSDSACTCGHARTRKIFPARGPWVQRAPGLPCALDCLRGHRIWHRSDGSRRENAGGYASLFENRIWKPGIGHCEAHRADLSAEAREMRRRKQSRVKKIWIASPSPQGRDRAHPSL